ncbi:MAG: SAM-dependent methyltransferase [Actinobacteria bacterium]|nr:SAM-dependent methyltransferase [Actinomycetota bacterium]
MYETCKSVTRRTYDSRFINMFFVGHGIDVGAGSDSLKHYKMYFPMITDVRAWDMPDGDAHYMSTVEDNAYDFVHSSHCLEHMDKPEIAFENWIRICKPGGHIIVTVPDEDLYEQGEWPSTYNGDHKTTWTIKKQSSWSPVSVNAVDFLGLFLDKIEIIKIDLANRYYIYDQGRWDQTAQGLSECALEFVVRKRTNSELHKKGRYSK